MKMSKEKIMYTKRDFKAYIFFIAYRLLDLFTGFFFLATTFDLNAFKFFLPVSVSSRKNDVFDGTILA